MRRLISDLMDEYVFEMVKLAYKGYRDRMPAYRAAEARQMQLAEVAAPALIDLKLEPDWQGCRVESFRFESPVECICPENRLAAGRLITLDPELPWTLVIPGYSTGALPPHDYGFFQDSQGLTCVKRGINVALIDLPYHMSRCRNGHGSGEGFFSPDLLETQTAFRQGAADAIALVKYLQQRFKRPVGLWGTSLGGNLGGLVASHVPDLGAAVLMEPLDNPGHMMQLLRSSREIRLRLAEAGVGPDALPEQLAAVAPSTYRPVIPLDRILFVSGKCDTIIPFRYQEAFWEAWGRPERIVLEHGHLTLPIDKSLNDPIVQFLAERLC